MSPDFIGGFLLVVYCEFVQRFCTIEQAGHHARIWKKKQKKNKQKKKKKKTLKNLLQNQESFQAESWYIALEMQILLSLFKWRS